MCVAARVPVVPFPGAADDLIERGVARLPTQLTADLFGRGDQDGRVAGTARPDLIGDRVAGDTPRRLDDLQVGEARAIAQVVLTAPQSVERAHRQDVRRRQVDDVNVIADAGAVFGWVVAAEDRKLLAFAPRDLQDDRDEVQLGSVILAAIGRVAGGVEVAGSIGIFSGSSNRLAVEERMKRPTPCATACSSRFAPATRLSRRYLSGCCMLSPTSVNEAKCMIPSRPVCSWNSRATASASRRSPATKAASGGTASRWPW